MRPGLREPSFFKRIFAMTKRHGRVALVTGGSRGIGRGIALALGAGGYRVAVNYRGQLEAAQQTAGEIEQAGGEAMVVQADIGSSADRAAMIDAVVGKWGGIDVLVNNAGITSPDRARDLLDHSEEAFDTLVATNLKGPHFLTQQVARRMIEAGAKGGGEAGGMRAIINISSISAFAVSVNRGDYCMAKAAMGMMTQVWAARLAEHGIGVYEVRPGIIASDMTAPVKAKYDKLIAEGLLPIARWGEPGDVAKAVVMLAEGVLAYTTGETIHVDGGFHIRRL
jgi:NAD(P)-dependent dehydrogenase (short-subunit alcohol dehydrogenase family)